ncbi:M3 family metallopeptidase [Tessaracoccus oleiagri]|uniref:Peptidyl-dipeptidase Dcp n=1 Tax=Tessaracoccus oleiagri TaxID=686624 RepID=A0A1G9LM04_9ACTN|nr:M3 family metallopeptidase [Tessaracoccus oleiagri]SDL62906.1 peptidyl-dipeptidase Dcp [Tessaracoccus oleiagri]
MTLPAFADYTAQRYRAEIDDAMRHQRDALAALRDDPAPATVANVLQAWEEARAPLNLVLSTFYTVRSSDATDEIDAVADAIAPVLAAHNDAIQLDRGLYDRLVSLRRRIDDGEVAADAQDDYHLDELLRDFERAGVALGDAEQERLRELNGRLAELSSQFQRLNREARNAATLKVDADELAGLSDAEVDALRVDGGYAIELVNTTQQPIAARLEDAGLRRRLLDASLDRGLGEFDTREVLVETARVRAERAALLGFRSHADLVAAEGTAKTTEAIESILVPLARAALDKARGEARELAEKYAELNPGAEFTAADWTFVEGALRKERFAFDESELDEYLTVERVVQAAYDAATDLYGITFRLREDLSGHVPDAQVYEIGDADGSPVGLFLMDLWARPTKNGGAWMTQLVEQSDLTGDLPVVTNNCNYRRAVPTVTWDEVITMFHEFGHALHGLFGKAKYASRSGTAVPRDFVEFPSQVNEHWAWQPGRVLPAEWLERLKSANEFGLGYAKAEALIAAVLDFVWHTTPLEDLPASAEQVANFEAAALDRHGLRDELVPPRYRTQYFAHIWGGGYAASYYGYTWAEVLDADAVAWFEEHGGGTRANGDHFRATLLGPGGGVDPMETYRAFRGRDPELQPLLDRLGLTLG